MERRVGDKYLTLLVSLWQPKTGLLTMANAAAIPPMILRGSELIEPVIEGFPLGLFADRQYDEVTFQTQAGDVILLYSDGIQHQPIAEKLQYGEARLKTFYSTVRHLPAQQIVEAIFADFVQFRGAEKIHDDQTLVAIRVQESERVIAL